MCACVLCVFICCTRIYTKTQYENMRILYIVLCWSWASRKLILKLPCTPTAASHIYFHTFHAVIAPYVLESSGMLVLKHTSLI
jgi:hypothetical protein